MRDFNEPVTRRAAGLGLTVVAAISGLGAAPRGPRLVTVLGDSITAGLGVGARDALPVRLEAELRRLGADVRVRGAGVSGDTTAAGLARVDRSVPAGTNLCVVALGANDLLRAIPPATTRTNLTAIVRRLKARRIPVLLCGIVAPPVGSPLFAAAYNATFPAVARAERVAFLPNFLAGVAGARALNQPDRIHPNPAGVRAIAANLAPAVIRALR